MDGHGLSIEGGRATRCHGRVQKRLGTRYRNAGVSWWGERERRYVSSFPFPSSSSSSTLSFSLSLPPFGWSLRLEAVHSRFRPRRQGLSISWPDRCGSGSSQHSIRPRLSSRERMMVAPQLRLTGHPAGNESSSFRRTNANGETNGVRGDEFESCKGLSFFSRSLIKTCWT